MCATLLSTHGGTDHSRKERVIVLPIPTSRDKRTVTGTEIPLEEIAEQVRPGALVAGYGIPDWLGDRIGELGGVIYDGAMDEELVMKNARLTAEGAVGRIITTEGRSPSELSVGVVGYGRIGGALVRLLLFLGSRVTVYSGKDSTLRALAELGIDARDYRGGLDLGGLDLLINTAPARLIEKRDLKGREELKIIDLASGNYLDGLPRVEKMPSIPEIMFPISAGRIYYESIVAHL